MRSPRGAGTLALAFALPITCAAVISASQPSADLAQAIDLYWSGQYRDSADRLSSLCDSPSRDDERAECLKYLAFSHVALGHGDRAAGAFGELLALDPSYALDPDSVSPKIQRQFEASRRQFVDTLFEAGKELYFQDRFAEARAAMSELLEIDPEHRLALEYERLAAERSELTAALSELSKQEAEEAAPAEAPEEEVDATRVYRLTSDMTPPSLVLRVDPEYPLSARRARREGTVVITVVVDRDGAVGEAKILRSVSPDIDQAALDAVLRWRYRPALRNGKRVAVSCVIRLTFELQ